MNNPTAARDLADIRAWVASSNKSTAHHSIKDEGLLYCAELLSIIAARDKELEQVKAECGRLQARLYRLIDADQQTMRDLCAELEQVKSGHAELVRACEQGACRHSFSNNSDNCPVCVALAKLQGSKA